MLCGDAQIRHVYTSTHRRKNRRQEWSFQSGWASTPIEPSTRISLRAVLNSYDFSQYSSRIYMTKFSFLTASFFCASARPKTHYTITRGAIFDWFCAVFYVRAGKKPAVCFKRPGMAKTLGFSFRNLTTPVSIFDITPFFSQQSRRIFGYESSPHQFRDQNESHCLAA